MSSSDGESGDPFSKSPFLGSLGVELVARSDGRAVLRLVMDERHLRTRGIAHGGLLSTLLDTAMGIAVSTGTPDGCFAVTAQLNVNFVRPGWNGEVLETTGLVCHRGQQTVDAVHPRPVHPLEKLTRIRGETLHITALTLGV